MTAIQPDDLEAAVAAGVLPETQADALRAFVAKRHLAPVRSGMEDERFRFHARVQRFLLRDRHRAAGRRTIFFTGTDPLYCLAAAAFMWALSELLVRRMRLVLPGILLSVLFVFFTYQSIPTNQLIYGGQTPRVTRLDLWPMLLGINATALSVTIKALIAAGIAGLYYWRFRLPFTILLIAASLVLSVLAATWYHQCPFGSARIERFPRLRPCGLCRSHGLRRLGSGTRNTPGGLRILAAPARSAADRALARVVRCGEYHAVDGPHRLGAGLDYPVCGGCRDFDRPPRAPGRRTDLRG